MYTLQNTVKEGNQLNNLYIYRAIVKKVVDGDTLRCNVDFGDNRWSHDDDIRVYGVDTPETRTKNKAEKEAGLKAKAFVKKWVKKNKGNIVINTLSKRDKYGRLLCNIYGPITKDCMNILLIEKNLAREYYGGTKVKFGK